MRFRVPTVWTGLGFFHVGLFGLQIFRYFRLIVCLISYLLKIAMRKSELGFKEGLWANGGKARDSRTLYLHVLNRILLASNLRSGPGPK